MTPVVALRRESKELISRRWDAAIQLWVDTRWPPHPFVVPTDIMEDPEFHCAICGLRESQH